MEVRVPELYSRRCAFGRQRAKCGSSAVTARGRRAPPVERPTFEDACRHMAHALQHAYACAYIMFMRTTSERACYGQASS